MYRKNLLRRVGLSFITLLAPLSLTACTMKLQPVTDINSNTTPIIEVIEDTLDSYSNSQFKDTKDTQNMSEELSEVCMGYGYDLQAATLVRVVDGDTIVVNIENEEVTIRLIGINTPESVAPKEYIDQTGKQNTEEGIKASDWLKDLLTNYDTVYLQKDVSDTDKYGRALRYVWLSTPTDIEDITEIQTKMLNGILLENGIAEVATYEPDTHYSSKFQSIVTHTTDLFTNDR